MRSIRLFRCWRSATRRRARRMSSSTSLASPGRGGSTCICRSGLSSIRRATAGWSIQSRAKAWVSTSRPEINLYPDSRFAPRVGLEPTTNGLTVPLPQASDQGNYRNPQPLFHGCCTRFGLAAHPLAPWSETESRRFLPDLSIGSFYVTSLKLLSPIVDLLPQPFVLRVD